MTKVTPLTGGEIAAKTLAGLGVRTIFSVSGNQILPVYDALPEQGIRLLHMRHESAAVYAAAAYAESTGQPGVALVSAGPGFVASLTGVAVARSMEVPVLLLSGAAPTTQRGRGGFQDIDQAAMARAVAKDSLDVATTEEIEGRLAEAWERALNGIPGPVHVSLPADLLLAQAVSPIKAGSHTHLRTAIQPDDERLRAIAERLSAARRPAIVARPSAARGQAGEALAELSRQLGVQPIVTGSPRGLSDLKFAEAMRLLPEADVVLAVAPADFAVGFLDARLMPGQVLLIDDQQDPRPSRLPDLHLTAAPSVALPALARLVTSLGADPGWSRAFAERDPLPQRVDAAGLHPLTVAEMVRGRLRPDDVIALDGGEFCQWVRLGLRDVPNLLLWNGKFGAIGGSLPQGIGLAASGVGRVIVIQGDGASGYHLSELETAAREGLAVTVIVGNDARWSAEWHQQARRYGPDRTFSTDLSPARYDLAAVGFGAEGAHVSDVEALHHALEDALASKRPVCLNVTVCPVASPAVLH